MNLRAISKKCPPSIQRVVKWLLYLGPVDMYEGEKRVPARLLKSKRAAETKIKNLVGLIQTCE